MTQNPYYSVATNRIETPKVNQTGIEATDPGL